MICFRIKQSETNLIAPILPTVMTIVIDMIVQDGLKNMILDNMTLDFTQNDGVESY